MTKTSEPRTNEPRTSEQRVNEQRTQTLIEEFTRHFQTAPTLLAVGPGRVNLIGEHTDYNDGFVLPVAIKRDIRIALRPRTDRRVHVLSLEYDDEFEFDLDDLRYHPDKLWVNYVQGVAWVLQERGIPLRGFNGVISGNVPRASGLSSSAAIEVATATALLAASDQTTALDGVQIALAAQKAENKFVGVNCGIMDQYISVLGQEGQALLIDCRSLEYQLIPFPAQAALVIGNTKASRSLASSAYNERRSQCEEGVAQLQRVLTGVRALRDVTNAQLEAHKELLSPNVYRRCRHVVSENERVLQTVAALRQNDLALVGELMNASHTSLRDDYEVSSPALDSMVEAMRSVSDIYGARLTGAGFGGCAVALVPLGREQAVADAIFEKYPKAANIWPEVYISRPGPGAQLIRL
jgi:galactokinase